MGCWLLLNPHTHLSGRQGDAYEQNRKARIMKKQMAVRSAGPPPGPPNVYDPSDDDVEETLDGTEEEIEDETDEEPATRRDGLPCARDIAQVYFFFIFPYICFCHVCFQHSFVPQVSGDRHAQTPIRMDFLNTVISHLFVCVIAMHAHS